MTHRRRTRLLEGRIGWRSWLRSPLPAWPDAAVDAMMSEVIARPATLDELPEAILDQIIAAFGQLDIETAGTAGIKRKSE